MTSTARNIVVVNHSAMMNDSLYRKMNAVPKAKLSAMSTAIKTVADQRAVFESTVERRLANGAFSVQQSNDIVHVENLCDNDAVSRLFCALKIDPRAYLYPQSQEDGKSSTETSNLKGYKKLRELAETIWSGASSLERVCKVWSVCAYVSAERFSTDVLPRDFSENFLTSREFKSVTQGSDDFWTAVDDIRAKQMSGGAATQTSQMVRTLVALKSAEDVRDGRAKHTRIDPNGLVMQALMRRLGQVTDIADATAQAVDVVDGVEDIEALVE